MNPYYPMLFTPVQIGNVRYKNRLLSAPNLMCQITGDGSPNERMIGYYEAKALGGAAQVTVGDTPVDDVHAPGNDLYLHLHRRNLPSLSELTRAIRACGAVASLELNHCGAMRWAGAQSTTSPLGPDSFQREDGIYVKGMNDREIEETADAFGRAAAMAKLAGFNALVIHGGHGWLLDQFLSPLFNHRTDQYGGSLENRARFPLLVVQKVREAVGPGFPLEYRLSGDELKEGGLTLEDTTRFAQMLDGQVEIIHVSAGLDTMEEQEAMTHPTIFLPHGVNVKYAAAIKKVVKESLVATVGAISDPDLAEQILSDNQADLVAMTRALIADPDLPNKAQRGESERIRPCLRCLNCLAVMMEREHFSCAVNPTAGREIHVRTMTQPVRVPKNVLVVGGGPAGMTAAATAADRGHKVTLAEKTDRLGGLLNFSEYDPIKTDLHRFRDYLVRSVSNSGVNVLLRTEVTPEWLGEHPWDEVILALGSSPVTPPIPGLKEYSVPAARVYTDAETLGQRVVILGGGLVGCELALSLDQTGREVTLVELQSAVAPTANRIHRVGLMTAMGQSRVRIRTNCRCVKVEADGVTVILDGGEQKLSCDTTVCALGMKANLAQAETLRETAWNALLIGDCSQARNVAEAVQEGFCAGNSV